MPSGAWLGQPPPIGLTVEGNEFKDAGMDRNPFDGAGLNDPVAPTALASAVPIHFVLNFHVAIGNEVVALPKVVERH